MICIIGLYHLKKRLKRIDPSNALLFSNLDVIVYATFGGDITETDLALYGEKL
ncbi:MAG: hypothetical protein L6V81_04605 [Clostridium sp.]|nr:MAG: hypothetical protein L6V81_04605 [Clostridium sp.]